MGFIVHQNSYLREYWNWIDFIVVIFAILELTPIPSVSLRPLRAFRILRPLKTIKTFPTMRRLASGMILSIPSLIGALFFTIFIMTQFSILGTSLFSGDYYKRCRTTEAAVDGLWPYDSKKQRLCSIDPMSGYQCPDGMICGNPENVGIPDASDHIENMQYIDYGFTNFDNLLTSYTTVFQVMTKEGWTSIMYNLMNVKKDWMVCSYFIGLIVIGAFFLLQLVVAIFSDSLNSFELVETKQQNKKKQNIAKSVKRMQQRLQGEELLAFNLSLRNTLAKSAIQQDLNFNELINQEQKFSGKRTEKFSVSESSLGESSSNGLKSSESQASYSIQSEANHNTTTNLTIFRPAMPKQTEQGQQLDESLEISLTEINLIQVPVNQSQNSNNEANKIKLKEPEEEPEQFDTNNQQNLAQPETQIPQRVLENRFYYFFYKICTHSLFAITIAILIITNYIILCFDRFPISQEETQKLSLINDVLTCCFTVEIIIRLIGNGVKKYCLDYFNILDVIIVCISIAEFIISHSSSSNTRLLLTAFRSFRILRIFKLAREWVSFRTLLAQIILSLKEISTFIVLMSLFIIIFIVLGMQFFAYGVFFDQNGKVVESAQFGASPERNFDNLYNAFLTVFSVVIGDGWNNIMYDFQRVYGLGAWFFFISLTIVTNIVLLNLLLAMLFEKFEVQKEQDDEDADINALERFKNIFQDFFRKIQVKNDYIKTWNETNEQLNKKNESIEEQEFIIKYASDLEKLQKLNLVKPLAGQFVKQSSQNKFLRMKSSVTSIAASDLSIAESLRKLSLVLLEGRSLYVFGPQNKFRVFCARITYWKYFEIVSLTFTLISTINLVTYSPLNDPESTLSYVNYYIDLFIVAIFTIEALLQILVNGFVINGKRSYIRQGWNVLDFIIVIVSLLSVAYPNANQSKIFKTLRFCIRVLRPLRLIQRNPGLKIVVESFINMIPGVISLAVVTFVALSAFAILGVNLFKSQFFNCKVDNIPSELIGQMYTYWDCLDFGGEWQNADQNYDNIFQGLKCQFGIMTTDGWYDVYVNALMSCSYYNTCNNNSTSKATLIFFIASLISTSIFLINMFITVVLSNFMIQKEKLKRSSLLTILETEYVDACVICYKSNPIISYKPTGCCLKDFCHKVVASKPFEYLMLTCIGLSFVFLILQWYGSSSTQTQVLEISNNIMTLIFTLEFIIKIVGLGVCGYFSNSWNILDLVSTIFSWIHFFVQMFANSKALASVKVIRVFRVFRFVRLMSRFRNQKILIMTFLNALPDLLNVGGVLLLFMFLYAVLGVHLFATVKLQKNLNQAANFQSLFNSMLTLMRMSTGEGWNDIMEDAARNRSIHFLCDENQSYQEIQQNGIQGCGQTLTAYIYFHSFVIFFTFIMINNFIAIILTTYHRQLVVDNQLLKPETIDEFCNQWTKYDPDATGFIAINDLENLITGLVQEELQIESSKLLKKIRSQDSILFNFHKNKLLTLFTKWKLQHQKDHKFEQIQTKLSRQFNLFMGNLHVPSYNNQKQYNFHDVLQSFIQYTFSQRFKYYYNERQVRIKMLSETNQELDLFDRVTQQSPEYQQFGVRDRLKLDELNYPEFNNVVFLLEQRNAWVTGKIWHLDEMQSMRRKLRQKNKKIIDDFNGSLIDSSKIAGAQVIQNNLKRRRLPGQKNLGTNSKQMSNFINTDPKQQCSESEISAEVQDTFAVNKSNHFKFQQSAYKQDLER